MQMRLTRKSPKSEALGTTEETIDLLKRSMRHPDPAQLPVRLDLLKVDVEGAELDVLAGIDDSDWACIRQVSGEIHLNDQQRVELGQTLRERGFDVTITQEPHLRGTPMHLFYATRP